MKRLIGIGRDLERGRDLSADARSWMRTVERAAIDGAVRRALAGGVSSETNDAVRRAVTRIAMQRGWELASIALPPAGQTSSSEGMTNGAHAHHHHHHHHHESNGGTALALSAEALSSGVPDDDVVLAYVRNGELARYVEAVANSNAAFAEELRGVIDGLIEAGESVGTAARRWRSSGKDVDGDGDVRGVAEARVVSLETAPSKRRRRTILVAQFALAATLVLGVGGYYVMNQNEKEAAIQAAKEKELEAKNAEIARLMKELEAQKEMIAQAEMEAKNAQTDMERAQAQAKLSAAMETQRKTMANVAAVRAASSNPVPTNRAKAACTCQAGDPLCSCL